MLDCCGTVFRNNKFEPVEEYRIERVRQRLEAILGNLQKKKLRKNFFIADIRDVERTEGRKSKGSAIGTVINIRNDNPEETFIKAILTINTFGECVFEGKCKEKEIHKSKKVDKFGLTCRDYRDVFIDTIIGTYSKLLEAELAQMYIRHSIREGARCRRTGRWIDADDGNNVRCFCIFNESINCSKDGKKSCCQTKGGCAIQNKNEETKPNE